MKVAVLGCGPAGLLAAHAAARVFGRQAVEVFSNGAKKSHLNGCQYLHAYIPGLDCGDVQDVRWEVWGDPANYGLKVYGPNAPEDLHTSVDEYGWAKPHPAWDLRRAYNQLWGEWGHRVHDVGFLTHRTAYGLLHRLEPDLVFSTVPAHVLCVGDGGARGHFFTSEHVWAIGDAPELDQYSPFRPPPFTVVCNAEPAPRWYRAANVFDYVTCEWPHHPKPPLTGLAEVAKPLRTNCNCLDLLPGKTFSLGRYGKWQKGVLTHQVYQEASDVCIRVAQDGVQGALSA